MQDISWEEVQKKNEAISKELDHRITERFDSYKEAGEEYAEILGITHQNGYQILRGFARDGIGLTPFPPIHERNAISRDMWLYRITQLYRMLSIEEDDPLVQMTREADPNFQYPEHTRRVPKQKPLTCNLRVSFSNRRAKLSSNQHGRLERIALKYGKKNLKVNQR